MIGTDRDTLLYDGKYMPTLDGVPVLAATVGTSRTPEQVVAMSSSNNTKERQPHVLILGAGLGGLTLAQALRNKGVSFEIFERDDGLDARSGGWAIALHT